MNPSLEQNNYLYVPNFLNSQEAAELAQWMFEQERLGILQKDPRSNFNLFGLAIQNALPFVKLLVKKTPEVSKLCGEEVLPTYAYSIIYKNNSELIRHTDRDACEISLTVNLQKDETDWPIWIQKPSGEEVSLNLNPGDAMMYLGCVADHWRDAYQGKVQTQVFFHYVRADGPRAYAYFDKERR